VPGSRTLLRLAPLLAGALGAAAWMRHRRYERARLPAPPQQPAVEPPRPAAEARPAPVDIVTIVDDLLLAER
jgi:uncharacterized iron-regulated membrane protein